MKAGIITFHRADNYGAVLQAHALLKVIEGYGIDAEIIDYRCSHIESVYINTCLLKLRKNLVKMILDFYERKHAYPYKEKKHQKFDEFRKKYLNISKPFFEDSEKTEVENQYDMVITGSDQIWNQELTGGKNSWYCYERTTQESHVKVVSYGASVGNLNFFRQTYYEMSPILKKYDELSVREQNLQNFLEQQCGLHVYKALDPTLLLECSYWEEIAECPEITTPYILHYDVAQNRLSQKIALDVARKKKMRLVHFNSSLWNRGKYQYAEDAGPCEFLGLIKNAEYVITSSFHGTVFSVIFKKKFITILHPVIGERVQMLLEEFDLEDRICRKREDLDLIRIDEMPDYNDVLKKLYVARKNSFCYLEKCITLMDEGCLE